MKQTPNQLFEQLSKEFSPKKAKEVINEELGKVVELKPLAKLESTVKDPFWTKFETYLAENSLQPLVNTEEKTNTKKEEEKIKALSTKVAGTVENIDSHNYDYSPSVNNINNVNTQEMLNGIQCEINYNKELTLDEAKELAVKNLAKDPLHYVKEGQFGVKGLGYTEAKVQVNAGKTYGGSGYSEKVKEGSDDMQVVKENKDKDCGCDKETINESLGQVVTTGNPNSLAAMSGQVIRQMMAEKEEVKEEDPLPMDEIDTMEAKGKDMDGDGDIDSDDYLASKDQAIKKAMGKKAKKESIDTKLAEIGKAGEITKMEAQLEFLSNHINEKIDRVSSINEDDNLKELIDKSKMKAMQKEIKLLEKRKLKMEKMYEKMSGKKYRKAEMVDEMDAVSWNEKNNPTRNRAVGEREPKKVGKSTSDYAINESKIINEGPGYYPAGTKPDGKRTDSLEGTPVFEIPKDTQDKELKPYAGKYLTAIGGYSDRNGAVTVKQIELIEKDPKKGWRSIDKNIEPTKLFLFGDKIVGYFKEDKSDPDYEAKKGAFKTTMKPEDREKRLKVKAAVASGDLSTLTFKNKSGQEDNIQDNPIKYILSKTP